MTWRTYYRQVAALSISRPWSITRQISTAVSLALGSIVAATLLFPSIGSYIPTSGVRMADIGSLAALFLLLSLLALIAIRFVFHAPYQIHQEQEQEIKSLKDTHHQTEDTLRQQVADLKAQLDKDAKREVQRQTVARILKEGQGILPPYNRRERAPDTPYNDWVEKGTKDLHEFVGEDYAVRWGSYEGAPALYSMDSSVFHRNRKISAEIHQRIRRLREFLAELGN